VKRTPITLVGDGIENPGNAQTMIHAAAMFGGECRFRDRGGLACSWQETCSSAEALRLLSADDLADDYCPLVALDNLKGAADVYSINLGRAAQPALIGGNERTGISPEVQSLAHQRVQIPMISRRINCLNVAAASAVALYYLTRDHPAKLQVRSHPDKRRPELMMIGAGEHVELGSAIRSAGAFGWGRLLIEDRAQIWFGCDRATCAEGRAAARRHRNPIHLLPAQPDRRYPFEEACVITTHRLGIPIHQANLARGPSQVIAIPDESQINLDDEDWSRLGKTIRFVHLDLPTDDFQYHYRLIASIALAEVARQVGRKAPSVAGRARRERPLYDRSLELLMVEDGEIVDLEELEGY
jgi:hypothetical protein